MTLHDRLLRWMGLDTRQVLPLAAATARADARPRCPKCDRVLLRFQETWLCSNCRRAVRRIDAA